MLVSVSMDGVHSGNGASYSPSISADGRYILFHSQATNLAAGPFKASVENLFFRDLQAGITYPLTTSGLSYASTVYGVSSAAMTPDGHSVVFNGVKAGTSVSGFYVWNALLNAFTFTNSASPVAPELAISPNGQALAYVTGSPATLYVASLASNTVTAVSPSGTFLSHAGVGFSADGQFLTYAMASSSTANQQNIYRYDLQTGANLLVSVNFNSAAITNAASDSPVISPDGRFIAYRSFATNIVPFDSNSDPNMFVYDASNNSTLLASANAAGNSSAADRSLKPVFSADGETLVFQSWAADISPGDFNNGSDIFALSLAGFPLTTGRGGATNAAPEGLFAQLFPAGTPGSAPVISWPLAAGNSYQVQYKTNLTDAAWLNLPGNVSFIGANGYLNDLLPSNGQRFYRIVSNP